MRSIRAGGAILSTVIVCELVPVGRKDGVIRIHTWAIVKWGSLPTAIPKIFTVSYEAVIFLPLIDKITERLAV